MEIKTLCILLMFVGIAVAVKNRMEKGMAGGIFDSAKPKSIPQDVVESALVKFESMRARLEGRYGRSLTRPSVTQVKVQVVRGLMYHVTIIAGLSPTPKESKSVRPEVQKDFFECHIKVWSQPKMNSESSLSLKAQDFSITKDCQASDIKDEYRDLFDKFLMTFKREYRQNDGTNEYEYRYSVFVQNMLTVEMFNQFEQGTAKYGPTKFADMTEAEFRKLQSGPLKKTGIKKQAAIPQGPVPEEYDWRSHGAVTPVKNQGMCGSCWAFSAIGNMEGQWQIKKGELISLSEQELVDCDKVDGGCEGGEMRDAYEAVIKLGGAMSEEKYPYRGENEKCKFNMTDVRVKINGYVNISKNETEMAGWLAAHGPISIGINALMMQFYFGGIAHPWKIFCNPDSLDHGVLIVGYGVKDGEPYWIVKNSWGKDWGEEGYYLVYRGDGTCGLNLDNTSCIVD
ncbi:cathepsin L-like [Strongylocentrotus purpuratus]|uniref:Cathepsin L n=1 Tax=Strongylocentrotus purpuratus TaxID=7668 RepID=A0A7M7T5E6_STRPU|nr:cathepsin L-like [Strongylocentrotus purpuratus]